MDLAARVSAWPRGIVPPGIKHLTMGVDLGKYLIHWIIVGWGQGATAYVVDYGRLEVASTDLGVEHALVVAMRELRDLVRAGWPVAGGTVEQRRTVHCDGVWIDAGYMSEAVYAFCRESRSPFLPYVGRGAEQQRSMHYRRPTSTGSVVRKIGQNYHLSSIHGEQVQLVEIDADFWKTWVHERLSAPIDQLGAMTFYKASPQEHFTLAKHLTAETKTEEFIAGRGVVTKWQRLRRQNHWFDAIYAACAAGHAAGVRLIEQELPPKKAITLAEWYGHH
jgi:phage terminase large subunit GpA-like protein